MRLSKAQIADLMDGVLSVYFTDRELAFSVPGARHLRGGKITRQDCYKLAGTPVHALGVDELGNMIYISADGFLKNVDPNNVQ